MKRKRKDKNGRKRKSKKLRTERRKKNSKGKEKNSKRKRKNDRIEKGVGNHKVVQMSLGVSHIRILGLKKFSHSRSWLMLLKK